MTLYMMKYKNQKVKYGINGFINLMCIENPNEDMTLMFFKTLTELSDLDIRVLKCFLMNMKKIIILSCRMLISQIRNIVL